MVLFKTLPLRGLLTLISVVVVCAGRGHAAPVPKTNPLPVYMHYMPWFETPATLGGSSWGYHWKFNNKNPNIVDANGRRQIASHYYPLIGPYASRDADVIEYHMLLMKYAGVDGVLIDWYGQQGTNGDIGNLLTSSNAIVSETDDIDLKFGVVVEDRFWTNSSSDLTPDITKAKANFAYLKNNYFNNPQYIRQNAGADPLVAAFGPIRFQTAGQWTQILAEAGEDVDFLTLWYEKNDAGANADGEYAWIYQDAGRTHLQHQSDFFNFHAPTLGTAGGSAYPGFNDYYQEGGTSTNIGFEIHHDNGQTLAALLTLAQQKSSVIDFLQLNTWNDFGEGTMFEPTVETGYAYLEQVQDFTGVPYGKYELEFMGRLFRARKQYAGNVTIQEKLDAVSEHLVNLNFHAAHVLLDTVTLPGDFDADMDVDGADFLTWQRNLGRTGLYPVASQPGDVNSDGVVDFDDYLIWYEHTPLKGFAVGAGGVVPEPATALPLLTGIALVMRTFSCRHASEK
jgi:hypothetical protein